MAPELELWPPIGPHLASARTAPEFVNLASREGTLQLVKSSAVVLDNAYNSRHWHLKLPQFGCYFFFHLEDGPKRN